jgi:DNA-binding transcriptional regulator YhcF (GntR family)
MKSGSRNSLYLQLALDIERQICRGLYNAEEPLPSLKKICQTYQISFMTAFRIYDELVKRGLIRSIKGKGYFINQNFLPESAKQQLPPCEEIVFVDYLHPEAMEVCAEMNISGRHATSADDLQPDYSTGIILNYSPGISRTYKKLEYRRLRMIVLNNYFPELHCVMGDNFHAISNILDRMQEKDCKKIVYCGYHFTDLGQANLNEREYAFEMECKRRNLNGILLKSGKMEELIKLCRDPATAPDGILFGSTTPITHFLQEAEKYPELKQPYKVTFGNTQNMYDGIDTWYFPCEKICRAAINLMISNSDADWMLPSVCRVPGAWFEKQA